MLESLRRLGSLGFSEFEVLVAQPHFWAADMNGADRRDMPRTLADEGLHIASVNLPGIDNNLVSSTREMRAFTIDTISGLINLCGDWKIGQCVIVPGRTMPLWPIPREQLTEWFVEGMNVLADRATAQGVTLLIENVPNTWIPHATDIVEALAALGREDVGVIYDVANAPFAGEDPNEGVRIVRDYLRLAHVSDTPTAAWRHDPVGTGDVDFVAFNMTLRDIGYQGITMLELITPDPDRHFAESAARLAAAGWATNP
jgi:sugar phosphate isomerase/epimerase